jgi:hypothetical protein
MNETNEIQLTDGERLILTAIRKDGQFTSDPMNRDYLKEELKNLMWKEFIERDKSAGLSLNVFIGGWFFPLLLRTNF